MFHGWPDEWVNSPPKFEDIGVIETGQGYRLRKLRYEIVSGFQSVAILYEPERRQGKLAAILNVNGHVGPPGKAVEYKQKRCINFAKRGMVFLRRASPRGEPALVRGTSRASGCERTGNFPARNALDYLYNYPNMDRNRVGSPASPAGGWQTFFLSSLDERVKVAVPVAAYSSVATKVEARRYGDLGDIEQNGTDLLAGLDFRAATRTNH